MAKKGGIGPVPVNAGNGVAGDVQVSRLGTAWRAVYICKDKKTGKPRRSFGTGRPSVEAAVQQLAHAKLPLMSEEELTRLVVKMREMMSDRCNADDIRTDKVKVFHQIYGVLRDGKEMSPLFQTSQDKWKAVARKNGGIYHCWYPPELETIIHVFFPCLWSLYSE